MILGKIVRGLRMIRGGSLCPRYLSQHYFKMEQKKSRPLYFPDKTLKEHDPELADLLDQEQVRQWEGIELIASENFTGSWVTEVLGSCLTNKYSEGQIGMRYYGGNEIIDKIEALCKKRALQVFGLNEEEWGVNVQPYSGSPANFEVYTAVLKPGDKLMGLHLPDGGHLTHGYQTEKKKISASSHFFQSRPYRVDPESGLLDYDKIAEVAAEYKPNLLISGHSAYPRDLDHKRFREIADSVGALYMCDMAHISGLIAAGEQNIPFEYCDIVTSTTHKTLRGPRSGMIFYNKKSRDGTLGDLIDFAVFPMLQGGPHNNAIGALCAQFKEVLSPEWKGYVKQIKANASKLAESLIQKGYQMSSGGTDNHLVLWKVKEAGLTGSKVQKACEYVGVSLNKNCVPGDKSALNPGGVRIGLPAMTARGVKEADVEVIADILDEIVKECQAIQEKVGKKLADFLPAMEESQKLKEIAARVRKFSKQFELPGADSAALLKQHGDN